MTDLTTVDHWDETWSGDVRMRLPSPWLVVTRNLQQLLRKYVRAGDRFLEIGCAPGKLLAWVASALGADVSGLDYSERGLATARRLFDTLRLTADFRCEDLRHTTFEPDTFDVVLSVGVIEHFEDPREVVEQHLRLVRPGGTALMTVPNYRGLYGTLQRHFDAPSLLRHNLEIMTCDALVSLVSPDSATSVRAYPAGRLSPWQVSLTKRWPGPVAQGVAHLANVAGLLQPFEISALCPFLVLEVVRGGPTQAAHRPSAE